MSDPDRLLQEATAARRAEVGHGGRERVAVEIERRQGEWLLVVVARRVDPVA